MSDRHFRPATLYLPFDHDDWAEFHAVRDRLGMGRGSRRALQRVLDRVESRARDRFAMTVWSLGDLCTVVGRRRGLRYNYGDEPSPRDVGIGRRKAEDLMREAHEPMLGVMTMRGWEVLEDLVAQHVPTARSRPPVLDQ